MVIYDNTGTVLLDIEVDDTSVRYKAIKGENSLTLKFSLAEHVEVPLGAYCVFKNETYSLMLPEDFTLHHRRDFEYTLVMYSEDYSARRYKFVNPVDRRLKFSLTAKPIEHLQMFVDNMNMRDSGWEVGECPDHVEIVLSYNHTYCHDALVQLANELELDYWFNGKIVNLGKLELNKDNPLPLSYGGDGEGLKSDIKRTNYSDGLPVEVLYVQGSSTNIDPSKYRVNDKPVSELHLPLSQTIGFDGTYFEDEDGYDATKARQYKTDENGFSIRRADKEVVNHSEDSLDCSEIEPTKTETVVSVIEVNTEKHFYDILFESTVDYSKYIIEGEKATVIFQSGMLAGKEFDLATDENGNLVCKQEDGKWRVEIVPQEIDGITMPDSESGYMPVADDTFKVFGIQLPQEYISDNDTKSGAEWDMFRYAVKHLYANEDVQYTISGTLDEIYAKRNWDSIKDRITLGSYISFTDKSFQEEALLIRVTGIKEYVNKPYSPILEISNAALSGTLIGTLNRIENQEVQTEDMFREAIGFTKRRWRDAKETISMLQGAIDGFSEGINPVTVETMSMLVGDERLQFVFTEAIDSDVEADFTYTYIPQKEGEENKNEIIFADSFIKHMTLGIDSISPVHADEEYKRWVVSGDPQTLDNDKAYYLYAVVSKGAQNGSFVASADVMNDTDEDYCLLVGILNSPIDGERSFARMYGYTEVRPGQIVTESIRSSDGKTWLDLLRGILHLNDMAGVSGVKTDSKGDQSIAAWFGGLMKDRELDEDVEDAAKSVIRHDGTGYFADGLFKWDKVKGINLGNGQININYDGSIEFGGDIRIGNTGEETLDSLLTIVAGLTEMWHLDDDGNVCTDRNVIIAGDTSSGGEGQDTPAEGTVTGIEVNGTPYGPNTQGVIDLSAAFNAIDVSDQLSNYYTKTQTDSAISAAIEGLNVGQYATKDSLDALQAEVDNIDAVLGIGETAEGYINTWAEVVAFLDAIEQDKDLASILETMNTNIGNNATDIESLATRVKAEEDVTETYKEWWADLKKWVTVEDGNVKISTNLIVSGDTSSGGSGEDTPASGTVTGIKVNGETYEPTAGIVTIPDYPTSLTWESISGKPSFATVATSGKYSDLSGLPTIPTVPTKVSAFTNDSGYITGITKSMVASALGASTGGRYLIDTGGDLGWGTIPTKLSQFTDDVVSGKYLPLSGGTMKGSLNFNAGLSINSANTIVLEMYSGADTYLRGSSHIYLSTPSLNYQDANGYVYPLIHSGNIGSYKAGGLAHSNGTVGAIVNSSGNVGIGTTTDSGYKLDVNGVIKNNNYVMTGFGVFVGSSYDNRLTNGLYAGNLISGSLTASDLYLYSTAKLSLYGGGGVAINGAVTMSSTLSVGGNITASSGYVSSNGFNAQSGTSAGKGYGFSLDPNNYGLTQETTATGARVQIAGYEGVRVKTASGYGLYPATNNAYTLGTSSYQWSTVYGVNGIFSGDTSSGSDIRFKDIIKDKTLKIADIAKAPLFTFKWNDREDDSVHLGSSAQYWEKVCPWLVTGEDFKSLNYATLGVAMGISLAKKAVNHEARIKELEKENKELKETIRRIQYGS